MEEKQAYFSLLQRKLKITKFKGCTVGLPQMLSLWWTVILDGQTHLSLKQEHSYRSCTTAVLGALRTRGTGQLLSQPQCSARGTLRCITFLLMLQESSPVCQQGRHSPSQVLLWPCSGRSNTIWVLHRPFWARNDFHGHQGRLLKGPSNVTKVLVKQVPKWCKDLLCRFHTLQHCNFFQFSLFVIVNGNWEKKTQEKKRKYYISSSICKVRRILRDVCSFWLREGATGILLLRDLLCLLPPLSKMPPRLYNSL